MYYTIYKTTNVVNDKIYIGSHKTIDFKDSYLGSGKHLKRAIEKYGIENFEKELLFIFDNSQDMYDKEKEIVNEEFIKRDDVYNMKVGGFGGWDHVDNSGKIVTSETREKMSQNAKIRQLGENNSFYNKSHTNEAKNKIGKSSKNRAKSLYDIRILKGNHPNNFVYCPKCNKYGQYRAMKRWHFDNCANQTSS